MQIALRFAFLFVLAVACGSVGAAGVWYGASGLHRHGAVQVHVHGSRVSLGLSFGLPLVYSSRRGHVRHYRHRQRRSRVVYRPAPAVSYRQVPRVVYRRAPTVVYGQVAAPRPRGCREFVTTVVIGGRPQPAWGVACPRADGSWRVVN